MSDKEIEITITGNKPHIGKTIVAVIIQRALRAAGFAEVAVISQDKDFEALAESLGDSPNLAKIADVKIRLIDSNGLKNVVGHEPGSNDANNKKLEKAYTSLYEAMGIEYNSPNERSLRTRSHLRFGSLSEVNTTLKSQRKMFVDYPSTYFFWLTFATIFGSGWRAGNVNQKTAIALIDLVDVILSISVPPEHGDRIFLLGEEEVPLNNDFTPEIYESHMTWLYKALTSREPIAPYFTNSKD